MEETNLSTDEMMLPPDQMDDLGPDGAGSVPSEQTTLSE